MAENKKSKRRRRRSRRRSGGEEVGLNINSLMDVVTIILLYLLKTFATSPITPKPEIALAPSTTQETVEEATVIMVTGDKRRTGAESFQAVTPAVYVDDQKVFDLVKEDDGKGQAVWRIPSSMKRGSYEASALLQALKKAKDGRKRLAEMASADEDNSRILILADRQMPYRVLMDLLITSAKAEYGEFKFVVAKKDA